MPALGVPELLIIFVILMVMIAPVITIGAAVVVVWFVLNKSGGTANPTGLMVDRDLEHLKILSIFYYIMAGLSLLPGCIFVGQLVMGASVASGRSVMTLSSAEMLFVALPVVFLIIALLYAVGSFLTGRYLRQQKNYTFCLIIAGLSCLGFPVGTILGVFSLVVLSRPSVKGLFQPQKEA